MSTTNGTTTTKQFEVALPAGGRLELRDADEVELWTASAQRYIDDYGIAKANDLMLLGAILSQGVAMYRAQRDLTDHKKAANAQNIIIKAAGEIRELEKALGIDKKTREAGGQHTVVDYVTRLKRAAQSKGIRIAERTLAYEEFAMGLRWRMRVLRNADDEDRRHHGITEEAILAWIEQRLGHFEEQDKKWAKEQGRVFTGKL